MKRDNDNDCEEEATLDVICTKSLLLVRVKKKYQRLLFHNNDFDGLGHTFYSRAADQENGFM